MECQKYKNENFRHHLLFAFSRDVKATEAVWEIREIYGQEAMLLRTAPNWFKQFKDRNFDLADVHRIGRPVEFNEKRLSHLIHEDQRQVSRKLAKIVECFHTIIERHLHSMGNVPKLSVWVPHPPYSPDLTLLDFHLFRSLLNVFCDVFFNNNVKLWSRLDEFFESRSNNFRRRGSESLLNIGKKS